MDLGVRINKKEPRVEIPAEVGTATGHPLAAWWLAATSKRSDCQLHNHPQVWLKIQETKPLIRLSTSLLTVRIPYC